MEKLSKFNPSGYIDLHIHSNFSDGTFSPEKILKKASELKLKAISITDHDTLDGIDVAYKVGIPKNLKFIPGVEISVSPPSGFNTLGNFHILGYGVTNKNLDLYLYLKKLRKARENRAKKLLIRLTELGIILKEKEILKEAKNSVIGRPHFARVMIKKGFVKSFREAFDLFLGFGRPAYISKGKASIKNVFNLIKQAGGISVFAHPYLSGINTPLEFEKLIIFLKSIGLSGIEAIYPKHSRSISKFYCEIACKHGLIISGGSDFHEKNDIFGYDLNKKNKGFYVPCHFYEDLINNVNKNC